MSGKKDQVKIDLEFKQRPGQNPYSMSEMRKLLARTLSKFRGDLEVTRFSFQVSIQEHGFKSGD